MIPRKPISNAYKNLNEDEAMIDPANPDYSNTPSSPIRPQFGYLPVNPHEQPCVSIVTPFYNTGEEFHETALSVSRQSLQQWEWIIINDGSTNPASKQILEAHRQSDARIRIIDHAESRGPSAARNMGIRLARAKYVVFVDSDDLVEPTAIEKWVWFLESHPEFAFVSGYSVGFGAAQYLWRDGFHSGREILNKNTVRITAAIRKCIHSEVGGFREDIRTGMEDWQFWLSCAEKGYWGDTIPEYLDWYRRRRDHSDRWEDYGLNEKHKIACAQIQAQYAHLAPSFPKPLPKPLEIYPLIPDNIPFRNQLKKGRRRLLLLIPWMTMGGADKFNLDLITQLAKRDWEISIIATLPGDNCWFPQFARITPDIFILDHFLTLTDWPRFICYIMGSRQVDHVLISNSDFSYSVLPYLKGQFPHAVFTDFCHMEEEYWKSGGYPRKAVESQPLLDMNIVSSEHLREWMVQRGAEADRVSVCYTNINTVEWHPQPENRESVRRELKIANDVPIILYAGRIHPQKQPRVFAETMLRIRDSGAVFAAIVAGDGPEFQWLQSFMVEHRLQSNVKLLGALSNERLKQILQASDIFFLPSKMEGISLAIYEAMACGIAVVGADVGGQKELVTPACGCLIPRASEAAEAETYASLIAGLLKDPARLQALGAAGRQRIVNGFELQDMGQRMHTLLLSAADWNRTRARLAVNPGLGKSLISMAIDYHRIEKLLRDVWPFYMWIQRNRGQLELLFPSDKIPPSPEHSGFNRAQNQEAHPEDVGKLASLQLLEESIYNLFAGLPERILQAYLGEDVPSKSTLLEDILAMRRRILPEIGRWQMQTRRIAIYGIGTHTQALLGTLPILMPFVQCFIDQRASGAYLGRPCIQPEALNSTDIDVVIYSSKRWEGEMYQRLAHLSSIEHVLIYKN
jgi:glycosyltransferase involved in cell wall biosynthesis